LPKKRPRLKRKWSPKKRTRMINDAVIFGAYFIHASKPEMTMMKIMSKMVEP